MKIDQKPYKIMVWFILSIFVFSLSPHLSANEKTQSTLRKVYLPSITTPLPVGWSTGQGRTNSSGQVVFTDTAVNGQVLVQLRDNQGRSVPNAQVYFLSNGSEAKAFLLDSRYNPAWGRVEYSQSARAISPNAIISTIVIGGILAALTIWNVVEFVNDPPRVDLELGYIRTCFTYNQFINTIGVGTAVFALYTGSVRLSWAALRSEGLKELIPRVAPYLYEATGNQWPWQGTWCFRVTNFAGITWVVPETDTIRHALFRTVLRWDTGDTDVDLHLYSSSGGHAYWADLQGILGGELDRDDRDGWGPETYRQYSYQGASYYDVWVHYYYDYNHGPVNASVEIFDENDRRIGVFSKTLRNREWWYIRRFTPQGVAESTEVMPLRPDFIESATTKP